MTQSCKKTNFLSMSRNSRRKKSQQQRIIQEQVSSAIRSHSFVIQAEKPHSLKHSWLKSLHLSWKLICSFIVALVTIGGLTSYFVLLPKIDVQPGISLNTKSPFETRFFLQNQSVFPIYNVLHQTAWTEGMPDQN